MSFIKRLICCVTALALLVTSCGVGPVSAQALPAAGPAAPGPALSAEAALKGLRVNPAQPWQLQFLLQTPDDTPLSDDDVNRLVTYFMAGVTVPEKDWWVNLSPFEQERVMPEALSRTQMGREILAQDYLLKRVTSNLMHPDNAVGKRFWASVYEQAFNRFGTTDVPVNTLNKVWIVPEKVTLFESDGSAYAADLKLKVMLEHDYLAMRKTGDVETPEAKDDLGQQVAREIILPALEKEVNTGAEFHPLRQIILALALASWYKKVYLTAPLSREVGDRGLTAGLVNHGRDPSATYRDYVHIYKEGAFNFIREEAEPQSGETLARRYFSGGIVLFDPGLTGDLPMSGVTVTRSPSVLSASLPPSGHFRRVDVAVAVSGLDDAMNGPASATGLLGRWLSDVQAAIDRLAAGLPDDGGFNDAYQEWLTFKGNMPLGAQGEAVLQEIDERLRAHAGELSAMSSLINAITAGERPGPEPLNALSPEVREQLERLFNRISTLENSLSKQDNADYRQGLRRARQQALTLVRQARASYLNSRPLERLASEIALKQLLDLAPETASDLARGYLKDHDPWARAGFETGRHEDLISGLRRLYIPPEAVGTPEEARIVSSWTPGEPEPKVLRRSVTAALARGAGLLLVGVAMLAPLKLANRDKVPARGPAGEEAANEAVELAKILATPPGATNAPVVIDLRPLTATNINTAAAIELPRNLSRKFIPRTVPAQPPSITSAGSPQTPASPQSGPASPGMVVEYKYQVSEKDEYYRDQVRNIKGAYNLEAVRGAAEAFDGTDVGAFVKNALAGYVLALSDNNAGEDLQRLMIGQAAKVSENFAKNLSRLTDLLKSTEITQDDLEETVELLKSELVEKGVYIIVFNVVEREIPFLFVESLKIERVIRLTAEESLTMSKGLTNALPLSALVLDDSGYRWKENRGFFEGRRAVVFKRTANLGLEDEWGDYMVRWTALHEIYHAYAQWRYQTRKEDVAGRNPELYPVFVPLMFGDLPPAYYKIRLKPLIEENDNRNMYGHAALAIVKAAAEYLASKGITADVHEWLENAGVQSMRSMALAAYDHPEWFGDFPDSFESDLDIGPMMGGGIDGPAPTLAPRPGPGSHSHVLPKVSGVGPWLQMNAANAEALAAAQLKEVREKVKTPPELFRLLGQLNAVDVKALKYEQLNGFVSMLTSIFEDLKARFPSQGEAIRRVEQSLIRAVGEAASHHGWTLVSVHPQGQSVGDYYAEESTNATVVVSRTTGERWVLPPGFRVSSIPFPGIVIVEKKLDEANTVYRILGKPVADQEGKVYDRLIKFAGVGNKWVMFGREKGQQYGRFFGHWPDLPELFASDALPLPYPGMPFQIGNTYYQPTPAGDIEVREYYDDYRKHYVLQRQADGKVSAVDGLRNETMTVESSSLVFGHGRLTGKLAKEADVEQVSVDSLHEVLTLDDLWIAGVITPEGYMPVGNAVTGRRPLTMVQRPYVAVGGSYEPDFPRCKDGWYNPRVEVLAGRNQYLGWGGYRTFTSTNEVFETRLFGPLVPSELEGQVIRRVEKKQIGRHYVVAVNPAAKPDELWILSSLSPVPTVIKVERAAGLVDSVHMDEQGRWLFSDGKTFTGPLADVQGLSGKVFEDVSIAVFQEDGRWLGFTGKRGERRALGPLAKEARVRKLAADGRLLNDTVSLADVTLHDVISMKQYAKNTAWAAVAGVVHDGNYALQVVGSHHDGSVMGDEIDLDIFHDRLYIMLNNKGSWFLIDRDGAHPVKSRIHYMVQLPVTGQTGLMVGENGRYGLGGELEGLLGTNTMNRMFLMDWGLGTNVVPANNLDRLRQGAVPEDLRVGLADTIGQDAVNILAERLSREEREDRIVEMLKRLPDGYPQTRDNPAFLHLMDKHNEQFMNAVARSTPEVAGHLVRYLAKGGVNRPEKVFEIMTALFKDPRWDSTARDRLLLSLEKNEWLGVIEELRKARSYVFDGVLFDVQMTPEDVSHGKYKLVQWLRMNLPLFKTNYDLQGWEEWKERYEDFWRINDGLNVIFKTPLGSKPLTSEELNRQLRDEIIHDGLALAAIIALFNVIAGLISDMRREMDGLGFTSEKAKRRILKDNPWLNEEMFDKIMESREVIGRAMAEAGYISHQPGQEVTSILEVLDNEEQEAILTALLTLPYHPAAEYREPWRVRFLRAVPFLGVLTVNLFYKGPHWVRRREAMLKEMTETIEQQVTEAEKNNRLTSPKEVIDSIRGVIAKYASWRFAEDDFSGSQQIEPLLTALRAHGIRSSRKDWIDQLNEIAARQGLHERLLEINPGVNLDADLRELRARVEATEKPEESDVIQLNRRVMELTMPQCPQGHSSRMLNGRRFSTKDLLSEARKISTSERKKVKSRIAFHPGRSQNGVRSRYTGSGSEVESIGEYDGGDIRHMDWNATARTGRPMSRRFYQDNRIDINLMINIAELNVATAAGRREWLHDLWRAVKLLNRETRYRGVARYYIDRVHVVDKNGRIPSKSIELGHQPANDPDLQYEMILKALSKYLVFDAKEVDVQGTRLDFYEPQDWLQNRYLQQLTWTDIPDMTPVDRRRSRVPTSDRAPKFQSPYVVAVGFNEYSARTLARDLPGKIVAVWDGDTLVPARRKGDADYAQGRKGGVDLSHTGQWLDAKSGSPGSVAPGQRGGVAVSEGRAEGFTISIIGIASETPEGFLGLPNPAGSRS